MPGVQGVYSTFQPRHRSLFPHFAFIPFVLILLRTLLGFFAFFCTHAKRKPFLFNRFRTLCQKHPGWGTPSATPARSSGQAAPAFFSPLWKLLLPNVESFGSDLSCV